VGCNWTAPTAVIPDLSPALRGYSVVVWLSVGTNNIRPNAFGSESDAHGARRGRRGIVRADYYGVST